MPTSKNLPPFKPEAEPEPTLMNQTTPATAARDEPQDHPAPSEQLDPNQALKDQQKQMNKVLVEAQKVAVEVNKSLRGSGPDQIKNAPETPYSDSAKPLKLEQPLYDFVVEASKVNEKLIEQIREQGRDHYTARMILKQAARQLGQDWIKSDKSQVDYSDRMPHNQQAKEEQVV